MSSSKINFGLTPSLFEFSSINAFDPNLLSIQIKSKLIANTGVENMMDQLQGDDAQYQSQLLDFLQRNLKEEEPTKK